MTVDDLFLTQSERERIMSMERIMKMGFTTITEKRNTELQVQANDIINMIKLIKIELETNYDLKTVERISRHELNKVPNVAALKKLNVCHHIKTLMNLLKKAHQINDVFEFSRMASMISNYFTVAWNGYSKVKKEWKADVTFAVKMQMHSICFTARF